MPNLSISITRGLMLRSLSKMTLVLVLSTLCSVAFALPAALPDQNGKLGGMQDFSGKPVIVFVTSLTKMADLGDWEEALRPKLPDINTLDIGDIDTSSKFVTGELTKELKKHVPKGVRIYLDDKDIWATEYQLDLGEPCVLIFDAEHNLANKFRGDPSGELLNQVIAAAAKYFPQKPAAAK
jgi:hypothetical protein